MQSRGAQMSTVQATEDQIYVFKPTDFTAGTQERS
jgi:hypothetical protein